jgi:hypothetical protein
MTTNPVTVSRSADEIRADLATWAGRDPDASPSSGEYFAMRRLLDDIGPLLHDLERLGDAERALEAVRALCDKARAHAEECTMRDEPTPDGRIWESDLRAALSAASPTASDEPARQPSTGNHVWRPTTATHAVFKCEQCGAVGFAPHPLPPVGCPGPAASGTPDGGQR